MKKQNFQAKNEEVIKAFLAAKSKAGDDLPKLNLSWSNWGFGMEELGASAARLEKFGVKWIELHGNRYGPDLGYDAAETKKILGDHGIQVAGVCGMCSPDSELASNRPHVVQRCIDYFRRNIELCAEVGGSYILMIPGSVGRTAPIDDME
ncbi:MAG: sugar phosphate isomerase/epimerase family protein, partial [Planctomycetota bacterium]